MKLLRMTMLSVAVCCWVGSLQAQSLLIDFNSTTQDGGPHNQEGYQPYDAGHEVSEDFVTRQYAAFGTTVSLTPDWPDTSDNRVEQMIDRGGNFDANYDGTKVDLVTDFLGIDTRTANGGNGDFDGVDGTPTRMTLALGGLPAGPYQWRSYHHDTEHVNAQFTVDVSTDGGASFLPMGTFHMTASSAAGSNDNLANPGPGNGPEVLSSTVDLNLMATGADDVIFQFTPLSAENVHNQIFGINGFELTQVPEPGSATLLLAGLLGLSAFRRRR